MWIADKWQDYELLDCGGGEKLERWDKQVLHGDNVVQSRQDVGGIVQRHAKEHQQNGGGDGAGENSVITVLQWRSSLSLFLI